MKHMLCAGYLVTVSGLIEKGQLSYAKMKEKDEVGLEVCGRAFYFVKEVIFDFPRVVAQLGASCFAAIPNDVGPCPEVIGHGTPLHVRSRVPCPVSGGNNSECPAPQ